MAADTATLCSALLLAFVFVSAKQKTITAVSGQDVTHTCRAPNNSIMIVEWSRCGPEPEYVFVYRDGQFVPGEQHHSFKNRVELQDRQMKDGDVSVILKDVRINDTGTYECRVLMEKTRSWELISIISLSVAPPAGPTGGTTRDGGEEERRKEDGGSVGLIVGLSASAVLLVAVVVGFVIYRKHKQNQDPYLPPDELQPV